MSTLAMVLLIAGLPCGFLQVQDAASCPQIYRVHGADTIGSGLNIVFLGDGFTADEPVVDDQGLPVEGGGASNPDSIERYRCAVALLVQGLMSLPVFQDHADLVRFYRVDLVSATAGIPEHPDCGDCSADPLYAEDPWTQQEATAQCAAPGEVGLEAPDYGDRCMELPPERDVTLRSLGSQSCVEGVCALIYPDSLKLQETRNWLQECGLFAHIVVVLENSALPVGAGRPDVAVATLHNMGQTGRYRLLAHELGHALLLLDEHTDGGATAEYHSSRNVAWIGDDDFPEKVYWAQDCDADRPPYPEPGTQPSACIEDLLATPCHEVRNNSSNNDNCPDPCPAMMPEIGLFEGAFFNDCKYYRPTFDCRMRTPATSLCPVCNRWIDEYFDDYISLLEEQAPLPVMDLERTDVRH